METQQTITLVEATMTDAEFLELIGAPADAAIDKFKRSKSGSFTIVYRTVKR